MTVKERDIVEALEPVRQYVRAGVIHQLFRSGLYKLLKGEGVVDVAHFCEKHNFDKERLAELFVYLLNEGLVERPRSGAVRLSKYAEELEAFEGWYTLFIGGYTPSLQMLGKSLNAGSKHVPRDETFVAHGSGLIGQHDSNPLLLNLVLRVKEKPLHIVDLGCGTGSSLMSLCEHLPGSRGFGVELDPVAIERADSLSRTKNLSITFAIGSASTYLTQLPEGFRPSVIIFAFVLHEILAQGGEPELRSLLTSLKRQHPGVHLAIIEVDKDADVGHTLTEGLQRAYYNPYFLFHAFTRQSLRPKKYWEDTFEACGYKILAVEHADPAVDSTKLELGFLIRAE